MSSKLTGLPVVTSLAPADLIYAVDVSDTTDDPAGTSVAITKANFGGGGGALTNLGTITNATPANFDWDGLDLAQYDRLHIKGYLWDTTTVAGERSLWFNGDFTDANYRAQRGYSVNGTNVAAAYTSSATISRVHGTDGKTDGKTNIDVMIEAPGLTGKLKAAINRCLNQDKTATQLVIDTWAVEHKTITAALTRVTFESCEGELTLFGEKYADSTGGGGYAAGTTVQEELGRITNATAGEFDFNSIPSGYDRLILKGHVAGDTAANLDGLYLFMNENLTPSTYLSQELRIDNGSSNTTKRSLPWVGYVPAASLANEYADVNFVLEGYDSGIIKKANCTLMGMIGAAGLAYGGAAINSLTITAPITRLRVRTDNHATDQLLGTLILYGERTV